MSESSSTTEKTITAENQFSDVIKIGRGGPPIVIVSGTFVATVTIQVKPNMASGWSDYATLTAPGNSLPPALLDAELRAGVKTGGFTSGSVSVVVSG